MDGLALAARSAVVGLLVMFVFKGHLLPTVARSVSVADRLPVSVAMYQINQAEPAILILTIRALSPHRFEELQAWFDSWKLIRRRWRVVAHRFAGSRQARPRSGIPDR